VIRNWIEGWGILITSVLFNVAGVLVLKQELNRFGNPEFRLGTFLDLFFQLLKSPVAILAGVAFFSAPFLFAWSLAKIPLAIAYPVQVGLNFLLVLLLSVLFLGEHLDGLKMTGTIFILIGVLLLIR